MKFPVNVPVVETMDLRRGTVYEHTPLDPYRGEYPRFIRPVGAHQPRFRTVWIEARSHAEAIDKALQLK